MAHDSDDDDDHTAADLSVTLTGSAAEVQAGDSVVFTARIINLGPRKARTVRAALVLTGQIPVQSVNAPDWSCDVAGPAVTCTRRLIRRDIAAAIAITATAPPGFSHIAAGVFVASSRRKDGNYGNNVATADITINHPPVVVDDTGTTAVGTPISIDVLKNDFEPDGDPMDYAAIRAPSHGTATCDVFGCLYTPAQGFAGQDSFRYTLADDRGGSASGNVTVTVAPPPEQPPIDRGPSDPPNSNPGAVVTGPGVVTPGKTGVFTTIISNGCTVAAENVVVRLTLPAGSTVMSAPSRSRRRGRILTIPVGTVRLGAPRGVGVRLRFGRNGGNLRTLVVAVRSSNGLLAGDGLVINVR